MKKLLFKLGLFIIKFGIDKLVFTIIKSVVIEIARELPDLTNEAKRQEAVIRIKKILKEKGEEIKDSFLNLVVEIAIQEVKRL